MNRRDPKPEWYELAIAEEKPPLTAMAIAARCILIGTPMFWLGVGAALWWLL